MSLPRVAHWELKTVPGMVSPIGAYSTYLSLGASLWFYIEGVRHTPKCSQRRGTGTAVGAILSPRRDKETCYNTVANFLSSTKTGYDLLSPWVNAEVPAC